MTVLWHSLQVICTRVDCWNTWKLWEPVVGGDAWHVWQLVSSTLNVPCTSRVFSQPIEKNRAPRQNKVLGFIINLFEERSRHSIEDIARSEQAELVKLAKFLKRAIPRDVGGKLPAWSDYFSGRMIVLFEKHGLDSRARYYRDKDVHKGKIVEFVRKASEFLPDDVRPIWSSTYAIGNEIDKIQESRNLN